MNTICLSMIVKNEEPCIANCLRSAAPYISYAVICDTGSTDRTIEIAKQTLQELGIPGEVHSDQWTNFAHNRNLSLQRCEGKSDYVLIMDADEVIVEGIPAEIPQEFDGFHFNHGTSTFEYQTIRLIRNNKTWKWESPVHEYLECSSPYAKVGSMAARLTDTGIGARNRSGTKFYSDLIVLEKAKNEDPENRRTWFYLGQTYQAVGIHHKAIDAFKHRIKLGGWDEEVYYSMYRIAESKYTLSNNDPHKAAKYFLKAYHHRPNRLEALVSIATKYREAKEYHLTYMLTNVPILPCKDFLFVDLSCPWRLREENALSAYYIGKYAESRAKFAHVLDKYGDMLSETDKARMNQSIEFCNEKLK